MIFNLLLEAFFLIFPLYYFKKHRLNPVKELGLEKKKASSAWKYSLIILGAMALASLALGFFLDFFTVNDIGKVTEALLESKNSALYFIFALTVGVVLEEFFFRGFLIGFFDKLFFPKKPRFSSKRKLQKFLVQNSGIFASSIAFGLMHFLYESFAEVIGAIVLGLALAYFWKKHRNLYANIYAHLLWNSIILISASMTV